ncbi:hypothetical protein B0H21DRAFT_97947 [Amylocystis lapponica]|nr:hypothetical protein B0H21DRAFT_97947 [Amylocystis lapponica]
MLIIDRFGWWPKMRRCGYISVASVLPAHHPQCVPRTMRALSCLITLLSSLSTSAYTATGCGDFYSAGLKALTRLGVVFVPGCGLKLPMHWCTLLNLVWTATCRYCRLDVSDFLVDCSTTPRLLLLWDALCYAGFAHPPPVFSSGHLGTPQMRLFPPSLAS